MVLIFGPIYSQYIGNLSLNLTAESIGSDYFSSTDSLMAELGITYWRQILSDIQRNLLIGPLIMFAVGSIAIVVIVFWNKVRPIVEGLNNSQFAGVNQSDNTSS